MAHVYGPITSEICPKVDNKTKRDKIAILRGGGVVRMIICQSTIRKAVHNGNKNLTTKKR